MEIIILLLLLLTGSYSAFLSAVLSSLSQDRLNEIILDDAKRNRTLHNLKLHFEETHTSFNIFEMFFYTIAAVATGSIVHDMSNSSVYLVLSILAFFLITIVIRSFIYSLGIRFADGLAVKLTPSMTFINTICRPLTYVRKSLYTTIGGNSGEDVSRDEIAALVDSAREEGSLDADEHRIFKNIIHFSNVYVSDVMTPRTVIFSCNADKTVDEAAHLPELKMYSRFPIWEGESLDDGVIGYVMSRDILLAALEGKTTRQLRQLSREVYIIPENAELDNALDQFLERRQHLFIAVDEYGGVEGLITMEDVLETILGVEIVDEADKVIDLRELANKRRDERIARLGTLGK